MKILYVVRHAKAGEHSTHHDFERVLTDRGRSDASELGITLKQMNILPDLIITSAAARTRETATLIATNIGYAVDRIVTNRQLYNAEIDKVLKVVRETDDEVSVLMVVGHNPGISEFSDAIFSTIHHSFPTAGVAGGEVNIDSWKDLKWACGAEQLFLSPA